MSQDTKKKTRTMYMHTLDGKPAVFNAWHSDPKQHCIAFAGQRVRLTDFAGSLRQIRREQAITVQNCYDAGPNQREWANRHRYGYVRVEVPNGR